MKKIVLIALICMMLSGTMVSALASKSDQGVQTDNGIAYLNLDEASPDMQEEILEARKEIIYNTDWVADGYSGAVIDAYTGEVIEELPHFSEVFPNWDVPIGEITEYDVEDLPQIGVSLDDFLV